MAPNISVDGCQHRYTYRSCSSILPTLEGSENLLWSSHHISLTTALTHQTKVLGAQCNVITTFMVSSNRGLSGKEIFSWSTEIFKPMYCLGGSLGFHNLLQPVIITGPTLDFSTFRPVAFLWSSVSPATS